MNHPPRHIAIVLDVTDPISAVQLEELEKRVERDGFAAGDEVSMWVLSGDGLQRAFHQIEPRRQVSPLWGNPRHVAARAESTFDLPLRAALDEAVRLRTSQDSPILESIRELTTLDGFAPGQPRRLILLSDLRQHTKQVSFYGSTPDFEMLCHHGDRRVGLCDLSTTDVEVFFLPRPRESLQQTLALQSFWCAYLKACGATAVRLDRL